MHYLCQAVGVNIAHCYRQHIWKTHVCLVCFHLVYTMLLLFSLAPENLFWASFGHSETQCNEVLSNPPPHLFIYLHYYKDENGELGFEVKFKSGSLIVCHLVLSAAF